MTDIRTKENFEILIDSGEQCSNCEETAAYIAKLTPINDIDQGPCYLCAPCIHKLKTLMVNAILADGPELDEL